MLNGEGDENGKKSIDLISKKKKNTLPVQHSSAEHLEDLLCSTCRAILFTVTVFQSYYNHYYVF